MKRLLLFLTVLTCCFSLFAQPAFIGTALQNGTYNEFALNDLGAFRQAQLSALSSGSNREWNFIQASGDFTINWRPYTSGQTLSGYNTIINPVTEAASARYNSGTGGQPGLLPYVQAGKYYTINITEFSPENNQLMAILESNWCHNCRPITAVSGTGCIDECGYDVTVTMAFPLAANEYVYVRYSTDNFGSSSLVPVSFSGLTGTATIPGQGAGVGVNYYVFSSNQMLAEIQSAVTEFGQVAYDLLTVNLNNNGGSNYSVAACTPYSVPPTASCQDVTVELNSSGMGALTAAQVDDGSSDDCSAVTLSIDQEMFDCGDLGGGSAGSTTVNAGAYSVTIALTPTMVNAPGSCPNGYGYMTVIEYEVSYQGTVPPDIFYTLQGVLNCDPANSFFPILNGTGFVEDGTTQTGSTTTSNAYNNNTDCATATPESLNCNSVDLQIQGPNIPYQVVNIPLSYGSTQTVTLTVEDGSGNTSTCTSNVTVEDNLPPSATCNNFSFNTDPGGCGTTVALSDPVISDNCDGSPSVSFDPPSGSFFPVGTTNVTVTVTDASNNSTNCVTIVTVNDNVAPTAVCQNTTVQLDATGNAS
ncbi:MAG: HYR domain-containing protein, partial [Lewinella sp.]|nr:HYR domain-containing protein [Lewinella sp.]